MKIHIATSELPLSAGTGTIALCGHLLRSPQWIWTAENGGTVVKEIFNALSRCKDCWLADWSGRYVYGMVEGVSQCQD